MNCRRCNRVEIGRRGRGVSERVEQSRPAALACAAESEDQKVGAALAVVASSGMEDAIYAAGSPMAESADGISVREAYTRYSRLGDHLGATATPDDSGAAKCCAAVMSEASAEVVRHTPLVWEHGSNKALIEAAEAAGVFSAVVPELSRIHI